MPLKTYRKSLICIAVLFVIAVIVTSCRNFTDKIYEYPFKSGVTAKTEPSPNYQTDPADHEESDETAAETISAETVPSDAGAEETTSETDVEPTSVISAPRYAEGEALGSSAATSVRKDAI